MAKWIYESNGIKECYRFNAKDEINHPISIGRSEEWVVIPKDAIYEGL